MPALLTRSRALVPENADIEGQGTENEDMVKMVELRPRRMMARSLMPTRADRRWESDGSEFELEMLVNSERDAQLH